MISQNQFRAGVAALATFLAETFAATPEPPQMLWQDDTKAMALARLPEGSFAFYNRLAPSGDALVLPDRAGRLHTLLPPLPAAIAQSTSLLASKALANTQVILTPDEQVVSVYVHGEALDRDKAKEVGLPRYLDVWLTRADSRVADEPRRIWRGYNGSQMEYQQLADGRLLVPFGSMQPHAKAAPPTGRHAAIVLYSDDIGRTWKESASKLIAPCYDGFNGSNEGACEPTIEPLRDGRLWMLLRTQAGFLYESFSRDRGESWTPATASRFNTSTGPANILRHRDGSLVVTWNNCELPRRHEGEGVYGGRDALHIAVSGDEGRTWRGFREIYLDHRRNDNPAKSGDRGTAYPLGAYTSDGRIVMLAGQGAGGRNPILIDPTWITATTARDDFSAGLDQWSVYKHYGPAKGWWRARTPGAKLVPHPTAPTKSVLHLRKADAHPADVAVWNFPNGWKGTLRTRLLLRSGCRSAMICLNDRFFDPSETWGQQFAVFRTRLGTASGAGDAVLAPDQWHEVALQWDLSAASCRLLIDGTEVTRLGPANATLNGISYVRLISMATELDPAGFLVAEVAAEISDPFAPACTSAMLREHEQRYVKNVVSLWRPQK